MTRQGKCANFGNCTKADSGEVIQITGQFFDCPECGGSLVVENKNSKKKWLLATTLPLIVLITGGTFIIHHIAVDNGNTSIFGIVQYFISINGESKPKNHSATEPNNKPGLLKTLETVKLPEPDLNACRLAPIEKPTQANWYAVIEIGSKGIKPIAVELQYEKGELISSDKSLTLEPQNVMPRVEDRIPDVVKAICEDVNAFYAKYGKLPIHLVGSSSMAKVSHHDKLAEAILKAVQLKVHFLTAKDEVDYLTKGVWVKPLPIKRHCEATVIDIGSGNIKGGYLEHCNPERNNPRVEKLVNFDIQKFGTTAFSEQAAKEVKEKGISFIEAAARTRATLEDKFNEQVRSRPEFTNGRNKRFYLVGGAAWALNTLLCLDCPQYHNRSLTEDQEKYTVIKPDDIEEFYNFVTQNNDKACSPSENPYIRRNLDGGAIRPWTDADIETQKEKILDVCHVFKANSDLISAAEILRAIAKEIDFTENSHVFFMQDNLYTWSRQYLIEKISKKTPPINQQVISKSSMSGFL